MNNLNELMKKELDSFTSQADSENIKNRYLAYNRRIKRVKISLTTFCIILVAFLSIDFCADRIIVGYNSQVLSLLGLSSEEDYKVIESTAEYTNPSLDTKETVTEKTAKSKGENTTNSKNNDKTKYNKARKENSETTVPLQKQINSTEPKEAKRNNIGNTKSETPAEVVKSTVVTEPVTYSDKEIISGDYIYEVIMDKNIKIVDYIGNDSQVIIPSKIDGYNVTTIENAAFICKTNLQSVTIPEGVLYVNMYAFYGCQNLRYVTLPNTLLVIENDAFRSTKITDIEIPDSVGVIKKRAFFKSRLRNIKIGKGINIIEDGALGNEKNLTITGYGNTVAFEYANENKIPFINLGDA